jgi:fumarate hydratase class II
VSRRTTALAISSYRDDPLVYHGKLPARTVAEIISTIERFTAEVPTLRLPLLVMASTVVAAAGAQGNFELNAMRPIIINNVLHSARILGDAAEKLRRYSVEGTTLDRDKVQEYVDRSLMLVTALSPSVGYDKASAIAHKADDEGTTLHEAALALGVSAADFDRIVDAKTMVGDPHRDLSIEQRSRP